MSRIRRSEVRGLEGRADSEIGLIDEDAAWSGFRSRIGTGDMVRCRGPSTDKQ